MDKKTLQTMLSRISVWESDIEKLEQVQMDIATNGFASATISSQGGSKSFTRLDLDKIQTMIDNLKSRIAKYKSIIYGKGNWRTIEFIYV